MGRVTTQTCGGRPRGGNNARVTTKRATRTMRSAQLAIVAFSTFALTRLLDTFVLSGRPVQREPAEVVSSRSALKCVNLRSFIGQHWPALLASSSGRLHSARHLHLQPPAHSTKRYTFHCVVPMCARR
eukprot:scaffold40160_cov63-Phaeocystis_antarctica.AAC.2